MTSAGNIVTSAKLVGSGMKSDISDYDSTKLGNALFRSFATALKSLCKTFPVIFVKTYAPFYSFWVCLILSRIFNLASIVFISGCIWLPSRIFSRAFVIIDPSSESLSVDNSSIEYGID